jgi:hypothetical protein
VRALARKRQQQRGSAKTTASRLVSTILFDLWTHRWRRKHETFDFLGFQHFCTRPRKWGSFVIGRRTIKKTMLRARRFGWRAKGPLETQIEPVATARSWRGHSVGDAG